MAEAIETDKPSPTYWAKYYLVKTSLLTLAAAFELASRYSRKLQEEIAEWTEDLVFTMGILPDGPSIAIQKDGYHVKFLGTAPCEADVAIYFKSLDTAIMPFTGQCGTHTSAAEKRILSHGNVVDTLRITRAMNIVQTYLFPAFILNKTFKRPPKYTPEDLWIKAKVMMALGPQMARNALK